MTSIAEFLCETQDQNQDTYIKELLSLPSDQVQEYISRLISMYDVDLIDSVKYTLEKIVTDCDIDINLKFECVKILYTKNGRCKSCFDLANIILSEISTGKRTFANDNMSTNIKVELCKYLLASDITNVKDNDMKDNDIKDKITNKDGTVNKETKDDTTIKAFIKILLDSPHNLEYRFKILLELKSINNQFVVYSYELLYKSKYNGKDDIVKYVRTRLLISQFLLSATSDIKSSDILYEIYQYAIDKKLDDNTRADSADILVHFGREHNLVNSDKTSSKSFAEIGKGIIASLSSTTKKSTIYDNKQNVHSKDIEASVEKYLKLLGSFDGKSEWASIVAEINDDINNKQQTNNKRQPDNGNKQQTFNKEKIESSLFRINIDNVIYPGNQVLKTIFIKIWDIVQGFKDSKEGIDSKRTSIKETDNKEVSNTEVHKENIKYNTLKTRILEELDEASGTCSSGFVTRIVNIMSGFGFNLNIGFKNQLKANVHARMNKLIRNSPKCDILLDELASKRFCNDAATNVDAFESDLSILDEKSDVKSHNVSKDVLEKITPDRQKNNKKELDTFLRENTMTIYDELYLEFVGKRSTDPQFTAVKGLYINHDEFEMWFRDAISEFDE